MKKLIDFATKYQDALLYLVFGALTTVVDFLVYTPLHVWCKLPAYVCNIFAWIAAVLFAFLTNKPLVFKSKDWSAKTVLPEFAKFAGCRFGSGLLETLFIAYTVDYLGWNGIAMKVAASVMVVTLNYVSSKLLVFNNRERS